MALLTTAKARYAAQLTYWQGILTKLQAQLTARAEGRPIDQYSFDSGEGRQSTTQIDEEKLMRLVEQAASNVARYEILLYGSPIVSLFTNRKG